MLSYFTVDLVSKLAHVWYIVITETSINNDPEVHVRISASSSISTDTNRHIPFVYLVEYRPYNLITMQSSFIVAVLEVVEVVGWLIIRPGICMEVMEVSAVCGKLLCVFDDISLMEHPARRYQ